MITEEKIKEVCEKVIEEKNPSLTPYDSRFNKTLSSILTGILKELLLEKK